MTTEEDIKRIFKEVGNESKTNDSSNNFSLSRKISVVSNTNAEFQIKLNITKISDENNVRVIHSIDVAEHVREGKDSTFRRIHSLSECKDPITALENKAFEVLNRIKNDLIALDGIYLAGIKMQEFIDENSPLKNDK